MTESQDSVGGPQGPRSSTDEWRDILRQIEAQARRDSARIVGVDQDADWETIGRSAGEAARKTTARAVGVEEDADWPQIGQHVERTVRSGVATVVGTAPDADWAAIGQAVDQRVRTFLQNLFAGKQPPKGPGEDNTVDPWAAP